MPYLPELAQMNIAGIGLLLRLQEQALEKESITTAQTTRIFLEELKITSP